MRAALPGDLLLRPVPLAAAAVLALNDHVLKTTLGDTVTGKLSDAAGLVFVPLLGLAIVELVRAGRHVPWQFTCRDLAAAVILVGSALVAAKLATPIAHGFGEVGGVVRYPFSGRLRPVQIVHDPTDLWTLPAMAITWVEGRAVIGRRAARGGAEA